jgi:hypothetical protein
LSRLTNRLFGQICGHEALIKGMKMRDMTSTTQKAQLRTAATAQCILIASVSPPSDRLQ